MSTTHNLSYTRFTRQVATAPMALLSTNVAAAAAAQLLQTAPWVAQTEDTPTFPPRAAMLTIGTPSAAFDAYKYCGDYADGKQIAYAGAVAYRFQVPAEALAGTVAEVVSVAVSLYVDRWLVDGVRIAAYVSDDETPPATWATVRDGDAKLSARLPMEYTAATPPARIVIEKNGTMTVTMPADLDAKKYLYVMVTLEDYETVRGFWIEGAALIVGSETVVTFDRSVTADPSRYSGVFAGQIFTRPYIDATGLEVSTQQANAHYLAVDPPSETDDDLVQMVSFVRSSLRENMGNLTIGNSTVITAQFRKADGLGNITVSDPVDIEIAGESVENNVSGMFMAKMGRNRVLYSSDFFATYKALTQDLPLSLLSVDGVAYKSNLAGLYSTTDDAETWDLVSGPPGGYYAVYNNDNIAVAKPGSYIKISTTGLDGSFSDSTNSGQRAWKNVTFFGSASKICAVTDAGDAYVTTNGGTSWTLSNDVADGTVDELAYGLISPADDVIVYMYRKTGDSYLSVSVNGGTSWANTLCVPLAFNKVVDLSGGLWAVRDENGSVLVTLDNGTTFQTIHIPLGVYMNTAFGSTAPSSITAIGFLEGTQRAAVSLDITALTEELQIKQSCILFVGGIINTDSTNHLLAFDAAVPAIPSWMRVDLRVFAHKGVVTPAEAAAAAYRTNPAAWFAGQDVGAFKHLASVEAKEGMTQIGIKSSRLEEGYCAIVVSAHIANIVAKPDPFVEGTWYGISWNPKIALL